MVAAACTQSREMQMKSGTCHVCQVAGFRRVYDVRLHIKATDQESQEKLDKEQNWRWQGGSRVHHQALESGAGLCTGFNENYLEAWEKDKDSVRSPVNSTFVSHFHFCSWVSYLKFLDQLSEKMKLDQMTAELGFDMRLDVVLARTGHLVRLESSAVIENKTIAYSLQRKVGDIAGVERRKF